MKNYTITLLISTFIFTACSAPVPTNTNVGNAANSASNQTTVNTNSTTTSSADSIANSTVPSTRTPMETIKALAQAGKNKDAAAMKSLVSKGTIALLEKDAKEDNTTVDELLISDEDGMFEELPEMRNENITGDKATVEVKDKLSNEWTTVPFVKEDGAWKIAINEYIEENEERMREAEKKMPANSGKKTGADVETKETNANKAANK